MLEKIITIILTFLPAGIANLTPVLVKKVKFLDYPLDFNKRFREKRIFGDHKTIRGIFFGILASIIVTRLLVFSPLKDLILWKANYLLIGFLLGLGALGGDAIKSFFKRQVNIKPGKSWIPFDQIDWILGATILLNLINPIGIYTSTIAIILFGISHPIVNLIGYYLKIKNNKF